MAICYSCPRKLTHHHWASFLVSSTFRTKGEPTFNVQKVPCEQELNSPAQTLGLYPIVITKERQKLLGAVQVHLGWSSCWWCVFNKAANKLCVWEVEVLEGFEILACWYCHHFLWWVSGRTVIWANCPFKNTPPVTPWCMECAGCGPTVNKGDH